MYLFSSNFLLYNHIPFISLSKFEVHDIYKQEMEFPTLFTVDMRSKISTFWNSIAKWKPHPGRHVLYTALCSIVYEMYVASYSSVVGFICLFFISDTVWEYLFLMYSKVVYILFWNGKMALTFIELLLRKPSHFSHVYYTGYTLNAVIRHGKYMLLLFKNVKFIVEKLSGGMSSPLKCGEKG